MFHRRPKFSNKRLVNKPVQQKGNGSDDPLLSSIDNIINAGKKHLEKLNIPKQDIKEQFKELKKTHKVIRTSGGGGFIAGNGFKLAGERTRKKGKGASIPGGRFAQPEEEIEYKPGEELRNRIIKQMGKLKGSGKGGCSKGDKHDNNFVCKRKLHRRVRKYAVVGILTLAAVVTPPDVITQVILFVAVYGLYEISILLVARVDRDREAKLREDGFYEDDDEEPLDDEDDEGDLK